jgi:hypothetical protein
VVIMLEGAGFEVFDLGVNTPPEKFGETVIAHQRDVVGFSALPHHDDADVQGQHRRPSEGLAVRQGAHRGGRRAGDRGVRQARWCRQLCPRRINGHADGQQLVGAHGLDATALEKAAMLIDETLKKG